MIMQNVRTCFHIKFRFAKKNASAKKWHIKGRHRVLYVGGAGRVEE